MHIKFLKVAILNQFFIRIGGLDRFDEIEIIRVFKAKTSIHLAFHLSMLRNNYQIRDKAAAPKASCRYHAAE